MYEDTCLLYYLVIVSHAMFVITHCAQCMSLMPDSSQSFSPNHPIWFKPTFPQFYMLPNRWAQKRLEYIYQLYEYGSFKSFVQLQDELGIPNSCHFRYLQLKHAVAAQVGIREVCFGNSVHEKALLHPERSNLISSFYSILLARPNHV